MGWVCCIWKCSSMPFSAVSSEGFLSSAKTFQTLDITLVVRNGILNVPHPRQRWRGYQPAASWQQPPAEKDSAEDQVSGQLPRGCRPQHRRCFFLDDGADPHSQWGVRVFLPTFGRQRPICRSGGQAWPNFRGSRRRCRFSPYLASSWLIYLLAFTLRARALSLSRNGFSRRADH